MADPSYGFSGVTSQLANSRPTEGGGSLYSAAGELSSAARSMQMSQGAMVNQTQAIAQMNQANQQQAQQLAQLIGNLNFSISQLASSVGQGAGAARAASMQAMAPVANYGYDVASAMRRGASTIGGAVNGLAGLAGLAGMAASGIGYGVGGMMSPFMGAQYQGPGVGGIHGSLGNAGFARSMAMGSGLGFMPGRGVGLNYSMAMEAGADRAGFKAGEIAIGATGGALNMMGGMAGAAVGGMGGMGGLFKGVGVGLGGMFGEMGGAALGRRMGGDTGAAVGGGIGNVLGTAGMGALVGGPVGAAVSLAGLAIQKGIEQTVGQIVNKMGDIRGNGEMFGRSAFRVMGPNVSRRTSQVDRTAVGAGMARMANEDLTFNNNDIQDIFAGGIENDLFRGVNGAQQTQRKMRELKDTVKVISQTLGSSIRESMDVMGQMQSVGIGSSSALGAIVSGSSVQGLTRNEALQGSMDFSNRYAGTGLQGRGLFNLGTNSQALGQTAMRMGLISDEKIAAVGGRAGVNQVAGNVTMALAQSGLGTMTLAASMGRGVGNVSGNAMGALSQAGGNASASNLVNFAANKGELMRDAIADPSFRTRMLAQVSSIADQFEGMGSKKDRMKLAMKSLGVDGAEASVFLDMMKAEPAAQKERINELTRSLSELQQNQLSENFNPINRLGRAITRNTTLPAAEFVAMQAANIGDIVNNTATRAGRAIFGVEAPIAMRRDDVTMSSILGASSSRGPAKNADVLNQQPDEAKMKDAKNAVGGLRADDEDMRTLRENDDKDAKAEAATRLIDKLAAEQGAADDPAVKKALALALSEQTGADVANLVFGSGESGPSKADLAKLGGLNDSLRDSLRSADSSFFTTTKAGAAIGGVIGTAAFGILGTVAGAAIGAKIGSFLGSQEYDDEAINRVSRSPAAARLLENKKKLAQPGLSDKERATIQKQINADKATMADDGISKAMIDRLDSLAGSDLEAAASNLSSGSDLRKNASTEMAIDNGVDLSKAIAEKAGLKNLATQFSGGTDNLKSALDSIAGLSGESQQMLAKEGGQYLVDAASITGDMTNAALESKLGGDKVTADMRNPDGTVNVDKVREYIIARRGSMDSNAMTATGSGAFTGAQLDAQLEISTQLKQASVNFVELASIVEKIKKQGG